MAARDPRQPQHTAGQPSCAASAAQPMTPLRQGAGAQEPRLSEVLRYLGHKSQAIDPELQAILEATCAQAAAAIRPRWVWRVFPLRKEDAVACSDNVTATRFVVEDTSLVLGGLSMEALLEGASAIALMAVTCGPAPDLAWQRTHEKHPTRALVYNACAVEIVERAADAANAQIDAWARGQGFSATKRYSPGYGDLPLSVQPALLDALDAQNTLGITLTPQLWMVPQKSITALIGLKETDDS